MDNKSKHKKKINVYFSWNELPTYGYFLLKYFYYQIKKLNININFLVISTKTPIKTYFDGDLEFKKKIIWIDHEVKYTWSKLNITCPDIFFQAGWYIPSLNYLGYLTRKNNSKSKIILLSDNSFKKKNIKQFLGRFYFKFFLKKKFDCALVPGKSGSILMEKLGFNKKNIYTGLYSCFIDNYKNKIPVKKRKKQIVCVTRLIKRKNINKLLLAFQNFQRNNQDFSLVIIGPGCLKVDSEDLEKFNIKFISQLDPTKLLKIYNESLFFILPSYEDHWPLVVHEASLCGNFLLLSNTIGNAYEFANSKNSLIFNPYFTRSMEESLKKAALLSQKSLEQGNAVSEKLGKKFNYEYSFSNFYKILKKLNKNINEKK